MGARNSRCAPVCPPQCLPPCPQPCPSPCPPMTCFPAPRAQCNTSRKSYRKIKPCVTIVPPPQPPVFGFPVRVPTFMPPRPVFAPQGILPQTILPQIPPQIGPFPLAPMPPCQLGSSFSSGQAPFSLGFQNPCFFNNHMPCCPPPIGVPGPYLPHSIIPTSPVLPAPLSHGNSSYGFMCGSNSPYPLTIPSNLNMNQTETVLQNNVASILNDQYNGLTGQNISYPTIYQSSYQNNGYLNYEKNGYSNCGGLVYPGMYGNKSTMALSGIPNSPFALNQFPQQENDSYSDSLSSENKNQSEKNLDQQLKEIDNIQNLANADLSLKQAVADHNANEIHAGGAGNLRSDQLNMFNSSPYSSLINQAISNYLDANQASFGKNPYSDYWNSLSSPFSGMRLFNFTSIKKTFLIK